MSEQLQKEPSSRNTLHSGLHEPKRRRQVQSWHEQEGKPTFDRVSGYTRPDPSRHLIWQVTRCTFPIKRQCLPLLHYTPYLDCSIPTKGDIPFVKSGFRHSPSHWGDTDQGSFQTRHTRPCSRARVVYKPKHSRPVRYYSAT